MTKDPIVARYENLAKDSTGTLVNRPEEQLLMHHERLLATIKNLAHSNRGLLSTNEELTAFNEEFQSMNEELLSTNEELETSKEELQSLNEELVRVNAELHSKVEELHQVNNERKLSEKSLRASEQRYRSLFGHMLEGYAYCKALYDEKGRLEDFVCLNVNDAFTKLTGLENVLGRNWTEVVPGVKDLSPELFDKFERISLTGVPEKFEFDFKSLGRWHSLSVYSPERGYFVVVFDDITERKRSEGMLLEYRKIIESSRDLVCVLDRDHRFLLANEAYLEFRNRAYHDLVGHTIEEVLDEEALIQVRQHINSCLSGTQVNFEIQHEYHVKGLRDLEVSYAPIEDAQWGNRIVCVIRDITEQRLLEKQLRQSQKMEAIGTLAGGVAHDFNNILTVIAGYASLIQLNLEEEEGPVVTMAEEIIASVERAAEMTRNLLSFSRRQDILLSSVDLSFVVQGLRCSLSRLISEDIELSINLAQTPLFALADKGQIEQLIMNLVVNARDAMPMGGTLVITTEKVGAGAEESGLFDLSVTEGYGLITVTDNGTGMDKEIQERIFEPYFTTKEIGKGTGLGLSMGYGIIKKHNGLITMVSEPGQGTTFKVYLPLLPEQPEKAQEKRAGARATGSETILLVEDDPSIRRMTKKLLEQYGYSVLVAENGEDALLRFHDRRETIDLLITDVIMPKMNGRQLYESICAFKPELPIIFMSGYSADIMTEKGFAQESINYLSKPLRPDVLFSKIREVLA